MKHIVVTAFLLIACSLMIHAQTPVRTELPAKLTTPSGKTLRPDTFLWVIDSAGVVSRIDPSNGAKTIIYNAKENAPGALEQLQQCSTPKNGVDTLMHTTHSGYVHTSDGQKVGMTSKTGTVSEIISCTTNNSVATDGVENSMAEEFTIYPNPSTAISSIDYAIPSQKYIEIKVYNVFGAEIATIQDGVQYQGQHSMKIETDTIEPGIYVVRFAVDSVVTYKKFVVAR